MSSKTCAFVNKVGKACTYAPVGVTPLTRTGEFNGVPHQTVDGKKVTGSAQFCRNHQIHEPWWPRCSYCEMSKVDFKASGRTAGCCRGCIDGGVWRKPSSTFTDPVLDVEEKVSPSGPWSTVVAKHVKRSTKVAPVNAAVAEPEEVRTARQAAEAAKAAAHAAENELARKLAEARAQADRAEQARLEAEHTRQRIRAFASNATPIQLHTIDRVLNEIETGSNQDLYNLIESIQRGYSDDASLHASPEMTETRRIFGF
jgi:hypothetical protein